MKKVFPVLLAILTLACCAFASAGSVSLPAYTYPGSDPIEAAVAAYLVQSEEINNFLTEEGSVAIPAPAIHKVEMTDDSHAKVYGSFWIFNYVLQDRVLETISGGEFPGIMMLEKSGDGWTVSETVIAGDGEEYASDIHSFCNGDEELEALYFSAADALNDPLKGIRTRYIADYVTANALPVDAYRDPFWDPIPLFE